MLTREDILKINDIEVETVEVPEWGGSIYVRGMTGAERDRFEASVVTTRGKSTSVNLENIRAKMAALSICDKDGVLLFTEKDVKVLAGKSAAALQRVYEVAQRLSRIGDEDIDELTAGLQADPTGDSPSD